MAGRCRAGREGTGGREAGHRVEKDLRGSVCPAASHTHCRTEPGGQGLLQGPHRQAWQKLSVHDTHEGTTQSVSSPLTETITMGIREMPFPRERLRRKCWKGVGRGTKLKAWRTQNMRVVVNFLPFARLLGLI